MPNFFYRLNVLLHRLDDAIRHERLRRAPDGLRLLRLQKLRLRAQARLRPYMRRYADALMRPLTTITVA